MAIANTRGIAYDVHKPVMRRQTVVKPGYVQARCPSSPIDLFGLFTFGTDRGDESVSPGVQPAYPLTASGSSAVGCTKQVEPYLGNCKRAARRRAARPCPPSTRP